MELNVFKKINIKCRQSKRANFYWSIRFSEEEKKKRSNIYFNQNVYYTHWLQHKKRVVCFDSLLPIFQKWYFSLLLASLLSKIDRSVEEWSRDEAFTYLFFYPSSSFVYSPIDAKRTRMTMGVVQSWMLTESSGTLSLRSDIISFSICFHILYVSSCSNDYDENHQLDDVPSPLVYSRYYASREEWKAIDTQYQV
jgi:hypothetical protein